MASHLELVFFQKALKKSSADGLIAIESPDFVNFAVMNEYRIFAAPLQGYSTAPSRHFHAELFSGVDAYFSPFVRIENGDVRRRDLADIVSPLNANHCLIPQIIFKDATEFSKLVDIIESLGFMKLI